MLLVPQKKKIIGATLKEFLWVAVKMSWPSEQGGIKAGFQVLPPPHLK